MKIGPLAKASRTSAPTIRYYEEIGLLPRADRRGNGQRAYGEEDLKRLVFIRRCRDFGFPIAQVCTLLALTEDRARSCNEAKELSRQHLEAVRAKLAELKALEESMEQLLESCDACPGGPGPDCAALPELMRLANLAVIPPAKLKVSKRGPTARV